MKLDDKKKLELTKIITDAVNDGIGLALERQLELKNREYYWNIPKKENYPEMRFYSSGLPRFWKSSLDEIDYTKILSDTNRDIELTSWKVLINYFIKDESIIKRFFQTNAKEDNRIQVATFFVQMELRDLIDSIIHNSKNPKLNSKVKENKITDWVIRLTRKFSNYDLIIPIIIYQPDCNICSLDENIKIQKISNKIQLFRNIQLNSETVVGAATHAIQISNILKDIPNDNPSERYEIIERKITENLALVTNIFSIINIAVNDSVGFCQVIAKPLDYVNYKHGNLYGTHIFIFKKHRTEFDYDWWREKKVITKKQLNLIKRIFNKHLSDSDNIKLAKRKLFEATIRQNMNDAVLDIATGLEALLIAGSKDNLSYKISLRSAIICKIEPFDKYSPIDVKKGVKIFYSLRSNIIHGGKLRDYNKNSTIALDSIKSDTPLFGKDILNHLLKFFILHSEEYRDVNKLDNYFLL